MQASLVMFKADGERKEFPLSKSEVVIGRKNTCDLRIPLSSVSRQHFKIETKADDKLMLRDLGSSNGTFYNGQRVLEAELSAGDRIGVGPVTFIVVVNGSPQKIEPVTTVLSEAQAQSEARSQAQRQAAQAAQAAHAPAQSQSRSQAAPPTDSKSTGSDQAPSKPRTREQPKAIETGHEMPAKIEEESHTPTVTIDESDHLDDRDEDPISALEALSAADQGDDDEDQNPKNSGEQDSAIPLLDDEDEPDKRSGK